MGTTTHDRSGALSADGPFEIRAARDAVDQLTAGHDVPAAEVARACETLLGQLNRGPASGGDTTLLAESLRTLLDRGTPLEDRGRVLGSMLALGPRAARALDAALDPTREDLFPGCWRARERAELGELAARPARERVQRLAEWLERTARSDGGVGDGSNGRNGHAAHADDPAPAPGEPLPLFPVLGVGRQVARLREGSADAKPAAPDPGPNPEATLLDRVAPEENRFAAAQALGARALPILRRLATEQAQRDVTVAALVTLGREDAHARAVNDLAARMQLDPGTTTVGDAVLDALDDAPRGPALDAGEPPGGWLQRSLDSCSAPAILAASAGRELAVLPPLAARLVAVRLARRTEEATKS